MHAFVAAVLLGLAGFDELRQHPKACPPGREAGEPGERVGGKRHPVVGADALGESVFLEQPREHRLRLPHCRGVERLAPQEVAAEAIGDCERITIHPVAGLELPLKSALQTSFGARIALVGLPGWPMRRRLRFFATNPWRFSISQTVERPGSAQRG